MEDGSTFLCLLRFTGLVMKEVRMDAVRLPPEDRPRSTHALASGA